MAAIVPTFTCTIFLHIRKLEIVFYLAINSVAKNRHFCRVGSDGSMSASGSAAPGFDPQRGSKFSFENFQPRG